MALTVVVGRRFFFARFDPLFFRTIDIFGVRCVLIIPVSPYLPNTLSPANRTPRTSTRPANFIEKRFSELLSKEKGDAGPFGFGVYGSACSFV